MATIGALVGALLTFVVVDVLDELVKILIGAAIGEGVGIVVWVQTMRVRRHRQAIDLTDLPKTELEKKAQRIDVSGKKSSGTADPRLVNRQ